MVIPFLLPVIFFNHITDNTNAENEALKVILLLQTAKDIHVRLDKAIHGHVCLR